jgi:hypothetical protein
MAARKNTASGATESALRLRVDIIDTADRGTRVEGHGAGSARNARAGRRGSQHAWRSAAGRTDGDIADSISRPATGVHRPPRAPMAGGGGTDQASTAPLSRAPVRGTPRKSSRATRPVALPRSGLPGFGTAVPTKFGGEAKEEVIVLPIFRPM